MRTFRFYKDPDTRWYVELPEWPGEKADLEMVAGADMFLEILAQGDASVEVTLSDSDFPGANRLVLKNLGKVDGWELGEGAWYELVDYFGIDLDMWLCDVTKFVFGTFPETIYFCEFNQL